MEKALIKIFLTPIKSLLLFLGESRYKTIKLHIINIFSYFGFSNSQNRMDLQIIEFFNHKKNGTCMEVGGADGIDQSNTLHLERKYNWNTYLVEPTSHQFDLCNKFRKKATVDRYAFVSEETFKVSKSIDIELDGLMSKISSTHNNLSCIATSIESVPTNTLDNYFKKSKITSIDILILDVESYEIEVLEGYRSDTNIINYLLVEIWDFNKFDSYAFKRGWKFIKKVGNDCLYMLR
jgi:FkbM family methyltransferase